MEMACEFRYVILMYYRCTQRSSGGAERRLILRQRDVSVLRDGHLHRSLPKSGIIFEYFESF